MKAIYKAPLLDRYRVQEQPDAQPPRMLSPLKQAELYKKEQSDQRVLYLHDRQEEQHLKYLSHAIKDWYVTYRSRA